jgi:transcription antitermination factor NusG
MPILRKESDLYPDDLFSIAIDEAPWQIVHVRSRQEKAVARLLAEWQQPFYLPQIEKSIRRAGRAFTSFLPLFGGYVFVRRTESTRRVLWMTTATVRVIDVNDQQQLDGELRQIRSLQQAGAILVPRADVVPGDAVRITEGVFQGYTGTVLRDRDDLRLVVSITALNKSVVAEFPRGSVRRLPSGRRNST